MAVETSDINKSDVMTGGIGGSNVIFEVQLPNKTNAMM
jgi:hypothetical protein